MYSFTRKNYAVSALYPFALEEERLAEYDTASFALEYFINIAVNSSDGTVVYFDDKRNDICYAFEVGADDLMDFYYQYRMARYADMLDYEHYIRLAKENN